MARSSTQNDVIQKIHGYMPYSELKVLIHRPEVASDDSAEFSAVAIQYPVYAQGSSVDDVIASLLTYLLDYLMICKENHSYAPCYADSIFQRAFDVGIPVHDIDIDARVSRELVDLIHHREHYSDLKKLLSIRDIATYQDKLESTDLAEIFPEEAAYS